MSKLPETQRSCPDCDSDALHRREFLKVAGSTVAAVGSISSLPLWAQARDVPKGKPESLVKTLYDSCSDEQRKKICYAWDHKDKKRGLLRTHVSANWHISEPVINTKFFTDDQKDLIRGIYEGIIDPEWHARIDKQLDDDGGGYGEDNNIAIFGEPGAGKFEFVMTGRHMTIRCDGDSADHVAFGGPIFYGHAADGIDEGPTHPGNVFWPQAQAANKLYDMFDGKQRQQSLVKNLPNESAVGFRGTSGNLPGIPVTDMSSDQREHLQSVLAKLIEPYRQSDRDEVVSCLKKQGGLDKCSLAFYSDGDIGNDKVWDCWRLEGPAFVWYFRGTPHVHVWVNVADDPSVKLNS